MRAPALSRLGKLEAGLMGAHAVYWLFTHPVNNSWLQRENLSGLGPGFFSLGLASKRGRQSESRLENWTDLRESWEYSQVARAGTCSTQLHRTCFRSLRQLAAGSEGQTPTRPHK
jgi:hypothetical protein